MRLILALILALPLAAQLPDPILFSKPRGLARAGLTAGVQTGSVNLLLHSGDFSNAAWGKYNNSGGTITVTAGATAPDNSQTAFRMQINAGGTDIANYSYINQVGATLALSSGTYTWAIWAKANTGGPYVVGLTHGPSGTNGGVRLLTVTSDWQLFTVTDSMIAGQGTGIIMRPYYNTSQTCDILIWHPQLNSGSTALPYVATTDLQGIASIPPGTATLVRGANTGAATDDPQVSNSGWTFDSGDRVSGLPAKGANWTTTNCSGTECYTVTSAGTEYINGEARRNLLRWSEGLDNAAWEKRTGSSVVGNELTFSADIYSLVAQAYGGAGQSGTYTITAEVKSATGKKFRLNISDRGVVDHFSADLGSSTEWVEYSHTVTVSGTTAIGLSADIVNQAAGGIGTIGIRNLRLSPGSTALPYQKTTDSREWALETPGNYVGLLTWWGRKERVSGPGEVLNDYRRYIRPTVNARGNSLP